MAKRKIATQCCIAGGGPAGMMLGLLLARAGVEVTVFEKHADFLRDFRGDTIHPSTMQLMHELGWLDEFLARPHQKVEKLGAEFAGKYYQVADFRHLPVEAKFIALMPQWDFLDFLAEKAAAYKTFTLRQSTEVTGLIKEQGVVRGVTASGPDGAIELRADLVIGADGRGSRLRAAAAMKALNIGAPMDVLWFRMARAQSDPVETAGRIERGRLVILLNRGNYWQCALIIPKGEFEKVKAAGLAAFRGKIETAVPFFKGRTGELTTWDKIKLLSVSVDRLENWARPGLLCIGDAAHAMSPIGGVGINLAIQDAVATANILAAKLRAGTVSLADLELVQKRREWPTRMTQAMQVKVQNNFLAPLLAHGGEDDAEMQAPLPIRILNKIALLQRLPARMVGLGIRPEHIHSAEIRQPSGGP